MIVLILQNALGVFDITNLVPTIKWSGNCKQCVRTLAFDLLSSPIDKSIKNVDIANENYVTLLQDSETLFEGVIFSLQKSTDGNTISVKAYDRGIYLKKNSVVKKYSGQTPESITRGLCTEFGIEVGEIISIGIPIFRNFLKVSIYDVIQTAYTLAAAKTGKKYQVVFKGKKLCVKEKCVDDRTLVIEGGSNLIDATITNSIESKVNRAVIYDKSGNPVKTSKDEDDNGLEQKITVNNIGNIANVTGGTVVVKEPYTGVYGLFFIDEDMHEWKKGLYLNKLVLNFKNTMDEKEVGSLLNKAGSKTKSKGRGIVHLNLS